MRHRTFPVLCCCCLALFLAGCGGGGSASPPPPTATPGAIQTPLAPPGAGCTAATTDGNGGPYPAATSSICTGQKAVEVDVIADPKTTGGFSPSNITISAGATVTWVWKAGGANLAPFHTAIEDVGFRFSKTFATPGTYPYQCQLNAGQLGIVHVQSR
jgi:plastocyanin